MARFLLRRLGLFAYAISDDGHHVRYRPLAPAED